MDAKLDVDVPRGGWLRRTDERDDVPRYGVLAYGLDDGVLLIWSDGSHTLEPRDKTFPASNWKVWSEIESF